MSIPSNISKEHIERAIKEIDLSKIPNGRLSYNYFLKVGTKMLPPKYILSMANKYANNEELLSRDFQAVDAKAFFKKLGFEIVEKQIDYFSQLKIFIDQTKTTDLTTSHYENTYENLKIKVSFGQGNQARVPWIAFLKDNQNVQNGIYPVYLFFKEKKLLILAYGVSETNRPTNNWNLTEPITIESYFEENNLGVPERYGSSFVYKTYKTDRELNKRVINSDLNNIIQIYNQGNTTKSSEAMSPISTKLFEEYSFFKAAKESGLSISNNLSLRFTASLLTKPFVILTGLSGSGKTKLAQSFAMWICENENQYCLVPVGADWTNREPLLGFPNALKNGEYVKPDNGVLDLLIAANANENKPYFLILDEMNLSHVERYFADFLSVMESTKEIPLHSGKDDYLCDDTNVPPRISLPKNLFIIGTVNIDETTYMFSPKVLDRASVIEFRVTAEEMKDYLSDAKILDLEKLESTGANMGDSFVKIAKDTSLKANEPDVLQTALIVFFKELKKTGAEFGYRSASEIIRFAAVVNKIEPQWATAEIIDAAIMQKLLPKLHGSRNKLSRVLTTLAKFCIENGVTEYKEKDKEFVDTYFVINKEIDPVKAGKIIYPISFEKIARMYKSAIDNGFTSYAEA